MDPTRLYLLLILGTLLLAAGFLAELVAVLRQILTLLSPRKGNRPAVSHANSCHWESPLVAGKGPPDSITAKGKG